MTLRYTCSFTLASCAFALAAQPTLTVATSVPAAGTTFPVLTSTDYVNPGPTGADVDYVYWDMLAPSTGTRNIEYLSPSVTPTSAAIPAATLLSTDGGSDTLFWDVTSQGLEQVGVKASLEGTIAFTDPLLELELPCTYGTTWSDPTGASYTVSGIIPVTRVGTVTGIADAYGTLTMPWEVVYPEVLRVNVRRDIMDNSAVANVARISNANYYYIPTLPHPVVKLMIDSVQIGTGAWTVVKSAQWIGNPVGVGMNEGDASNIEFSAYPNPATDLLNVSFAEGTSVASRVELLDAMGRVVSHTSVTGGMGVIDTKSISAGVYNLRVLAGDRLLGTRRVTVQ